MTRKLLMGSLLFVGLSSLLIAEAKATSTFPKTSTKIELVRETPSAGQYIYEISFTNHSDEPITVDIDQTKAYTEFGRTTRVGLMDREWEKPIMPHETFVGILGFEISPRDQIKELILR